jgi:hypothetical protein
MTRNTMHSGYGRIFPLALLVVGASLGLNACTDAESMEDVEGEELVESEAAEARGSARASEAPPLRALEPGSRLVFEVAGPVSTETHSAGDVVNLRLAREVTGSGGLVLPSGTPARGMVTASQPSEGADEEALLALRIESIRVDGRDRALNGEVVATEIQTEARDSRTRSAAKVATGAAAGAIIGQVLGRDTRSTVGGAAVGAAAGLGVALSTRGGHALLPEGSLVTVRLDDALVVN